MKISYNWLQDYFDAKLPYPKEIADKLTFHAFEIEGVEEIGAHFNNVVIGKVLKKEKHPNADRLNVCFVDVGDGGRTIVCGATNVAEGQAVAVALPGAVLPGDFAIKVSKIRGIESNGMICSERELGFTKEAEGIWVINAEVSIGTPIKEFLGIETDYVFDIKVLPDRAHDCLSHQGIAREISTIFSLPLKKQQKHADFTKGKKLKILIDSHVSKRYMGALVRGVKVTESPLWLQARLRALGQRPINNIVDITNYVMLETGQPLHAFDLAKVSQKGGVYEIKIKKSESGEKFKALDGVEYSLPKDTILISDNNETLGIAGIKGGEASAIHAGTTDILLEAAHFDPLLTRLTSQALKLRTESSFRFEKDLSPELAEVGLGRALDLVTDLAQGKIDEVCDIYPNPQKEKLISFSLEDIESVLGFKISKDKIESILESLGCLVVLRGEVFDITPPFARLDLELKENLIEEVGRICGYENVTSVLLPKPDKLPVLNKLFYYSSSIRYLLTKQGFSEIKTYSFGDKGKIEVLNPLASDKAFLREDLTSGVHESMKQNEYNAPLLGLDQIKVFEIGTVFNADSEHVSLCIGIKNVKGFKKIQEKDVFVDVQELLKKELQIELDYKDFKNCFFEANLEDLIKNLSKPTEYVFETEKSVSLYKPISAYPFILRDIAIFVPDDVEEKEVSILISKNAGILLVRQTLFDVFKKDGKVSYAFRLVFQSYEKTLSDDEINKVMEKIVAEVNKKGWVVR